MPVGVFEGRTALVTGGTDGIGREVARGLARHGVKTIIVGRDQQKGRAVENELRKCSPKGEIYFLAADLSLMNEAHRLADEVAARFKSLNYLVHGAGIILGRRVLTAEGVESNFAVNFLSRFALTQRLLPLLERTGTIDLTSRIVILGGAASSGKIFFDDINLRNNFGILNVVGQFCRANDLFTVEFARNLASGRGAPRVTITCLKIGVVKTNIRRTFPLWMRVLVPLVADPLLGQKPAHVAASAFRLLFDHELEGVSGALFLQIKKFKRLELDSTLQDPRVGARLWELAEQLSGSPQLQSAR
jgi:NAD(P)-dependent dehydrogenase (short-subunit alcohol dehydrogenase family)